MKAVEDMRKRLQTTWLAQKKHYDQIFDLQIFLRDAEQLNTISTSQEVGILCNLSQLYLLDCLISLILLSFLFLVVFSKSLVLNSI